ncbi:hypothetical protein KIW84_035624 [Lathyrus oleraceus]|uniref:Sugar phosphate transporter domain-containing protein n=1 Tax=Pisum sativum TaxID=3888 RepID=A0A9D4Y436_PEA|nr:hypothetical protein KIW84_UN0508 [Pisum sativum]KAI5431509.1 hypothetical protein KIW84_035624 [Pisum sativum]
MSLSKIIKNVAMTITKMMKPMIDILNSLYRKLLSTILFSSPAIMLVRMAIDKFGIAADRNAWPNIRRSRFAAILPLVIAHTLGDLLTNISLGKVSVSFTHTTKAMEPFFTVVLSSFLLALQWHPTLRINCGML